MLWYRLFAAPITSAGKRLRCLRPYDLPTTIRNKVPNAQTERLTRQSACSLGMYNRLQGTLLRAETPTFDRAAHLHHQSTTDKSSPADEGASLAPDLSLLSPELQQQWHVDRNMHLGPIKVESQSAIKAVWQCNTWPAGQPHVWMARVANRSGGSQCPYCCNRLVCAHNSLAAVAPDVAKYWNHSKNETAPDQVLAGSSFRAHWKCPACEWEWQAPIFMRTRKMSGCPKCSRALLVTQRQPTFAEAQPACLAEWDYERNEEEGFHPEVITLGSGKQVHWICSRCPRGQPHRWTASPPHRISQGHGCAVCAGRQACVCNSLESLFPLIAAEFDVDKNGFAPSEITAQSGKEVWWWTAKRGSWKQSPNGRTKHYSQPVRHLNGARPL